MVVIASRAPAPVERILMPIVCQATHRNARRGDAGVNRQSNYGGADAEAIRNSSLRRSSAPSQEAFGPSDKDGIVRVLRRGDFCKQPFVCRQRIHFGFRGGGLLEMVVLAAQLAVNPAQPVVPNVDGAAPL